MEGINVSGMFCSKAELLASNDVSCCKTGSFAFDNSCFSSLLWKLCTTVGSKQPLLGIRNFKNFRIILACKQLSRNKVLHFPLSRLIKHLSYSKYNFKHSFNLNVFANVKIQEIYFSHLDHSQSMIKTSVEKSYKKAKSGKNFHN